MSKTDKRGDGIPHTFASEQNRKQVMENLVWQKNWYLGFLGFIGFYKLGDVIAFFQGEGTAWDLANLLWFLWFLYFLPEGE